MKYAEVINVFQLYLVSPTCLQLLPQSHVDNFSGCSLVIPRPHLVNVAGCPGDSTQHNILTAYNQYSIEVAYIYIFLMRDAERRKKQESKVV